jgi:hypothetical protein
MLANTDSDDGRAHDRKFEYEGRSGERRALHGGKKDKRPRGTAF